MGEYMYIFVIILYILRFRLWHFVCCKEHNCCPIHSSIVSVLIHTLHGCQSIVALSRHACSISIYLCKRLKCNLRNNISESLNKRTKEHDSNIAQYSIQISQSIYCFPYKTNMRTQRHSDCGCKSSYHIKYTFIMETKHVLETFIAIIYVVSKPFTCPVICMV